MSVRHPLFKSSGDNLLKAKSSVHFSLPVEFLGLSSLFCGKFVQTLGPYFFIFCLMNPPPLDF